MIGENPNDIPNNLLPYVSRVAAGKLARISVFGDDYDTAGKTGVRDYIHVVDLARVHIAALSHSKAGVNVFSLCTGKGTSALELMATFSKACGKDISHIIVGRRSGDIAACFASPKKANEELSWFAEKAIEDACADAWRWQSTNPNR